jgi:Delta7-sterol 5-desaturase
MNAELPFNLGHFNWHLQVVLIFIFVSLRSILFAGGSYRFFNRAQFKKIMQGVVDQNKLPFEILKGLGNLLFDAVVAVALIQLKLFHFVPLTSVGQFLLAFAGFFVWSEVYFYYLHRLLHHPKLFWIHRHHHQALLINPWTSLSFSVLERLLLLAGVVALPALLSLLIPYPIEAYTAYFFFNYALNVVGHFNVEIMPVKFVQSTLGKFLFTPTYHTLHHMRYRGHYGLFTSVLDKWHGTYFSDYETVHAKAVSQAAVSQMKVQAV